MKRIAAALLATLGLASGQGDPRGFSVATPRPINPAENTTNPSALATQRQNPFLGSAPADPSGTTISLTLKGAIERGLRYNLGLIESNHASADARADRLRALSALLPQISARARQAYEEISFKEIGIKLPPILGFSLPATSGGFGYQDARVGLTQNIYSQQLRDQYRSQKANEQASALNIKDARDVVVFAVGSAYLQAIASAARVETAKAQVASASELDRQTADRVQSEVSPEIDSLRAQVERQSAEQRLTNALNQLEKDKLTLARIIGFPVEQNFVIADSLSHPLIQLSYEKAVEEAKTSRSDLRSAEFSVRAAEASLRAQRAQRLPIVSVSADYGGGGTNLGNMSQVYSVSANVAVPIYTGGRIHADIEQARADLARKEAEYADLKGRIAYDVKVAWLDRQASETAVQVAERNRSLAGRALAQSKDRYANGVTNYLEVVQAQEAVVSAEENYIESLYSMNLATISFARAMGGAEDRLYQLIGKTYDGN